MLPHLVISVEDELLLAAPLSQGDIDSGDRLIDTGDQHNLLLFNSGSETFIDRSAVGLARQWLASLDSPLPTVADYVANFITWMNDPATKEATGWSRDAAIRAAAKNFATDMIRVVETRDDGWPEKERDVERALLDQALAISGLHFWIASKTVHGMAEWGFDPVSLATDFMKAWPNQQAQVKTWLINEVAQGLSSEVESPRGVESAPEFDDPEVRRMVIDVLGEVLSQSDPGPGRVFHEQFLDHLVEYLSVGWVYNAYVWNEHPALTFLGFNEADGKPSAIRLEFVAQIWDFLTVSWDLFAEQSANPVKFAASNAPKAEGFFTGMSLDGLADVEYELWRKMADDEWWSEALAAEFTKQFAEYYERRTLKAQAEKVAELEHLDRNEVRNLMQHLLQVEQIDQLMQGEISRPAERVVVTSMRPRTAS